MTFLSIGSEVTEQSVLTKEEVTMDLEFLIPISFFGAVVYIFHIITAYKLRRKLVENKMVDENTRYLFQNDTRNGAVLKWGMVLISIGVAIIISQLVPARYEEIALGSAIFLFSGMAFILYYFMARNKSQQSAN